MERSLAPCFGQMHGPADENPENLPKQFDRIRRFCEYCREMPTFCTFLTLNPLRRGAKGGERAEWLKKRFSKNRHLPLKGQQRKLNKDSCGHNDYYGVAILFLALLGLIATFSAARAGEGIVFYKADRSFGDHVARFVEFTDFEVHAYNVNVYQKENGKMIRIMNSQVALLVPFSDLERGTFFTQIEIEEVRKELAKLKTGLERFNKGEQILKQRISRLESAVQLFDQGKVLQSGQWLDGSKIKSPIGSLAGYSDSTQATIEIGGNIFQNPMLKDATSSEVRILHSSGVVTIPTRLLSVENIALLNSTSTTHRIPPPSEKSIIEMAADKSSNQLASAVTLTPLVTSDEPAPPAAINPPKTVNEAGELTDAALISNKFAAQVQALARDIDNQLHNEADISWKTFDQESFERIRALITEGKELASKKELVTSIGKDSFALVEALSWTAVAAENWQLGECEKAYAEITRFDIPSEFSENAELTETWKKIAILQGDVKRRKQTYDVNSAEIAVMLKSDKAVAEVQKELDALLSIFPDNKLKRLKKNLEKDSLGL